MRAKHLLALVSFTLAILLASCNGGKGKNTLTLVSYNVQTFFDATEDGTEYKEFKGKKSKWSEEAYKERLERLCRTIKTLDADVYALLEVENEGVIQDICNTFPAIQWGKNDYRYAAFNKGTGGAFGCAVLSRCPITDVTVHGIDIRTHGEKQPPLRNILSLQVQKGSGITLFVNHWKSKVGGGKESAYWQNWQEGVLSSLFNEYRALPTIACGDFNRDIADFDTEGDYVRLHGIAGADDAVVKSAWSVMDNAPSDVKAEGAAGSYYYKGKWERIDNVFANPLVAIDSFCAVCNGEWAADGGKPVRYNVRNRTGYSDHLPVMATLHW